MSGRGCPDLFSDVSRLSTLHKPKPFLKHLKVGVQELVCQKISVTSGTLWPSPLGLHICTQESHQCYLSSSKYHIRDYRALYNSLDVG